MSNFKNTPEENEANASNIVLLGVATAGLALTHITIGALKCSGRCVIKNENLGDAQEAGLCNINSRHIALQQDAPVSRCSGMMRRYVNGKYSIIFYTAVAACVDGYVAETERTYPGFNPAFTAVIYIGSAVILVLDVAFAISLYRETRPPRQVFGESKFTKALTAPILTATKTPDAEESSAPLLATSAPLGTGTISEHASVAVCQTATTGITSCLIA